MASQVKLRFFFLFRAGDLEGFKTFLLAIFYVGKGQQSRPFNHLRDALSQQDTPEQKVMNHQSQNQ